MAHHDRVLDRDRSLLLVIDMQESYRGKLHEEARLVRATQRLLGAAGELALPVILTEQYPKGLGATVEQMAGPLEALQVTPFEKTSFSAYEAPGFAEAFEAAQPEAVVVIGMETHVCVYQTVRDLTALGVEVHLRIDGVSSRRDDHRDAGIDLCVRAGAVRTTRYCKLAIS